LPLPRVPRNTMHLPSTMIGEVEVENWGTALVSFRHTTLPVSASRQERTPLTPRVQTLPSATAGVLRGPGCPSAARLVTPGCAAYLSFHSSLPSPAARQRVTSSLSSCRVKT